MSTPPPEPTELSELHSENPGFELRWTPDDEFLLPIRNGLRAYNDAQVGPMRRRIFAIRVRDAAGTVTAGLYGWLGEGWLYTDWLWVAEDQRRTGLGARVLRAAEDFARNQGTRHARLSTASFQAKPFYLKLGYEVFAELPIDTPDSPGEFRHREYFLRKTL